jgi:hypothetical protein
MLKAARGILHTSPMGRSMAAARVWRGEKEEWRKESTGVGGG